MTQEWTVPAWAVVAILATTTLLALLVVVALVRVRRVSAHVEALLATPSAAAAPPVESVAAEPASYVITRLGDASPVSTSEQVPVVPPGVFAEAVVREGTLRTAALLHGVRRALAPEVRGRIRLEMRREVKRARKERRVEQRTAVRDWQARQRAGEQAGEAA